MFRRETMISSCFAWAAVFLFAVIVNKCQATVRIWMPSSNLDLPESWEAGQIPCSGDTVRMAERRAALLGRHYRLDTLNLPKEGELIFGDGADLEIVDLASLSRHAKANVRNDDPPHCLPGQDFTGRTLAVRSTSYSWFDPDNWMVESNDTLAHTLLDSERIPCNGDDVLFLSGQSFQVALPTSLQTPVYLRSFKIGRLRLTQNTIADYFTRPEVSLFFSADNETNAVITGSLRSDSAGALTAPFFRIGEDEVYQVCDPAFGCKCGNDRPEDCSCAGFSQAMIGYFDRSANGDWVMSKLCPFVENNATIVCSSPVQASGRCYPFCGAVLNFVPNRIHEARNQVQEVLKELPGKYANDVDVHVSILDDMTIQALFLFSTTFQPVSTDPGDTDHLAQSAAEFIMERLKVPREDGANFVQIETLKLLASDPPKAGQSQPHKQDTSGSSNVGLIVGVIFGLLLVVLLIAGLVLLWRKRRGLPFSFRQLNENDDRDVVEMEGPNFQNPMYHPTQAFSTIRNRGRRDDQASLLDDVDPEADMDNDVDWPDTSSDYVDSFQDHLSPDRRQAENRF